MNKSIKMIFCAAVLIVSSPSSLKADNSVPNFSSSQLDDLGNILSIWHEGNNNNFVIKAREKPAGGSWSAPVQISNGSFNSFYPVITVNSTGNAVALWRATSANTMRTDLFVALKPAGQNWQAIQIISDPNSTVVSETYEAQLKDNNSLAIFWNSLETDIQSNNTIYSNTVESQFGGPYSPITKIN